MSEDVTKSSWVLTDKRFVCFLDIMGFKDLVMRKSHMEIYDLLSNISKYRERIENFKTDSLPNFDSDSLKMVSFSDSIVIFTKTDSKECFHLLSAAAGVLLGKAIELGVGMKGAIAHGETSVNISRQIFFGQPIIDAYLLEEDVCFYGVILHNTVEEFINSNPEEFLEGFFKEIVSPLKSGKINHQALNWTLSLKPLEGDSIKSFAKHKINALKTKTSGAPRRYIDNSLDVLNLIVGTEE